MVGSRAVKLGLAMLTAMLLPLAFAVAVGSSILMGDLVVVGKEYERVGDLALVCVRYRAYGQTERTCVPATAGAAGAFTRCVGEAQIGRPLPESCR